MSYKITLINAAARAFARLAGALLATSRARAARFDKLARIERHGRADGHQTTFFVTTAIL